ncbi:MAG: hypothetical protein ACK4Z5_09035, partial [Brevundimonas sp.]
MQTSGVTAGLELGLDGRVMQVEALFEHVADGLSDSIGVGALRQHDVNRAARLIRARNPDVEV